MAMISEGAILLFTFALGAVIGSFLNVVILRYNTGMSLNGRSRCFFCGKVIRWYENLPVVSFFCLRGKCGGCQAGLSLQYPLVELGTAAVFTAVTWKTLLIPGVGLYTILNTCFWLLIMSFLIVIAVYDIRHTIIPNVLVYLFAFLSLAVLVIKGVMSGVGPEFYIDLAAGPLLFLPFWLLWFISGGRWMGLGDGKLALGIGWLLGLAHGFSALILGFWIGAAYALIRIGIERYRTGASGLHMKSEVPLGPFLIAGVLVEFLFAFDILQLRLFLSIILG